MYVYAVLVDYGNGDFGQETGELYVRLGNHGFEMTALEELDPSGLSGVQRAELTMCGSWEASLFPFCTPKGMPRWCTGPCMPTDGADHTSEVYLQLPVRDVRGQSHDRCGEGGGIRHGALPRQVVPKSQGLPLSGRLGAKRRLGCADMFDGIVDRQRTSGAVPKGSLGTFADGQANHRGAIRTFCTNASSRVW